MRTFFEKVHLWLALPAGLIVTMLCLTGAILVFEEELLELCYPERYFVKEISAPEKALPINQLILLVNARLENNRVASVKVEPNPQCTWAMGLQEGFRVTAFVNPYTGEITGIYNFGDSFFFKIMSLHRWLMDGSRTAGKQTVGITTILFTFILLSGIVIWVPKNRSKWKSRLTIKTSAGLKRFWHDLHVTAGMYASLFLVICALTGLMWSFEWYRNGVFRFFGADQTNTGKGGRGRNAHDQGKKETVLNTVHWDQVLAEIKSKNPGFRSIRIQDKSVTVLPKSAVHSRASDQYLFDSDTGEILSVKQYRETEPSSRIMTWAYALHVGEYGGLFSRIITFLASLVGASLPLTGYYLYFRRKRKSAKNRKLMRNILSSPEMK